MSNDLISRSKLIEFLKFSENRYREKMPKENIKDKSFLGGILCAMFTVFQIVNIQPCAYDVDKVIENLEDKVNEAKDENFNNKTLNISHYYDGLENGFRESIEIVRSGVVNG